MPAGTTVITEGDTGDLFYLIVSGEATVTAEGERRASITTGDSSARSRCCETHRAPPRSPPRPRLELLSLDRDEFLAAVTGHAVSAAEADLVVSQRLSALRPGVSAL